MTAMRVGELGRAKGNSMKDAAYFIEPIPESKNANEIVARYLDAPESANERVLCRDEKFRPMWQCSYEQAVYLERGRRSNKALQIEIWYRRGSDDTPADIWPVPQMRRQAKRERVARKVSLGVHRTQSS